MSYTVLARKYRPQTFDELVGQEHVARTLGNAIAQDRVAHAFLFTGVRGVGKTTTARLLAKALNCENGPTATPCNTCPQCIDITSGRDVDVQEIDGASHNSVDDVRRLQESLPFRPARDRFKIVIVDEVHMLSTGAFNAFLKTLEEPPSHVKFIFATTESHKVPVTIRSRCQRYDFRLIPQAVVASRVREILRRESIEADDGAIAIVAREAAGSMRDALTLLDQIVAFSGNRLEGVEIARQLGIAAREAVHGTVRSLLAGDGRALLLSVHEVAGQGVDALHFAKQVLELLRDLVVYAVGGGPSELVDWVEEERAWADSVLTGVPIAELQRAFAMTSRVVDEIARSAAPLAVLEMGLLRIATRPAMRSIEELLSRLDALESRIGRGGPEGTPGPQAGPGPSSRGPAPRPQGGPPPSRSAEVAPSAAKPLPENPGPTPSPAVPAASAPEVSASAFSPALAAALALSSRLSGGGAPASQPPAKPAVEARAPFPSTPPVAPRMPSAPAPSPRPEAASTRPVAPSTVPPAEPSRPSSAPGSSDKAPSMRRSALLEWEGILSELRKSQPALSAILEHGVPRLVSREKIVLAFQEKSFYGHQAGQANARDAIHSVTERLLGGRPEIEVRFDADVGTNLRTVAAVEAQRRSAELEARKREALGHPRVLDALDVFPEARGHADVQFDGES
ncbi:MAG: DNA polymerase III subunit gamma/tau [Polyangiales bacterium]